MTVNGLIRREKWHWKGIFRHQKATPSLSTNYEQLEKYFQWKNYGMKKCERIGEEEKKMSNELKLWKLSGLVLKSAHKYSMNAQPELDVVLDFD